MAKPQPEGMKTNYKTRLNYILPRVDGEFICMSKANDCDNLDQKCHICFRVQGKYTEFKEKGE